MTKTSLSQIAIGLLLSVALGLTVFSSSRGSKTAATFPPSKPIIAFSAQDQTSQPSKLDGCVTCHGQIEP
ncbi:MAG: hypothetical protein ACRD9S_25230, partial [Pyrinomonadaceae bacterium]